VQEFLQSTDVAIYLCKGRCCKVSVPIPHGWHFIVHQITCFCTEDSANRGFPISTRCLSSSANAFTFVIHIPTEPRLTPACSLSVDWHCARRRLSPAFMAKVAPPRSLADFPRRKLLAPSLNTYTNKTFHSKISFTNVFHAQNFSVLIPAHSGLVLKTRVPITFLATSSCSTRLSKAAGPSLK